MNKKVEIIICILPFSEASIDLAKSTASDGVLNPLPAKITPKSQTHTSPKKF